MKHCAYCLLLIAALLPFSLWAQQKDTIDVPSDFGVGEGGLNNAISAVYSSAPGGDSAAAISAKVFKLPVYGLHILTGTIMVPQGGTLTIVGEYPGTDQDHAPAMIVWTPTGSVNNRYTFDCWGNIVMKNVWLNYVNTGGTQVGSSMVFNSPSSASTKNYGTFDNCMFTRSPCPQDAAGTISICCTHWVGKFTNCYWRNCTDNHYRYYGRSVSFPYGTSGWHIDSIAYENCTFANMGYVYMQEGSEYGDVVRFNHCTFLNVVVFTLESGWWWWCSVTNSMFVNPYMYGDRHADRGGGSAANYPYGGTINIDSVSTFGFSVPYTEANRHVLFANNSFYIDQWLRDWYANNPWNSRVPAPPPDSIPYPQPMLSEKTIGYFNDDAGWPYLSMANLDSTTNPGLFVPPTNQDAIKEFLYRKWSTNLDTNWAWNPDYDANQKWPKDENLYYSSTKLRTFAMNGLPVGDLFHWPPASRYNTWKAQSAMENKRIDIWLATGVDPGVLAVEERPGIPEKFDLSQNYPNPFNPSTRIDYSIPEGAYVSLKVYDLLGQEVATLFEGEQHAGNYTATFDGGKLASGVYLYRLKSGDNSMSRKLVFMK
jgi:hypothetical protein